MKTLYFLFICIILSATVKAQTYTANGSTSNGISTAVPFLTISPDARAGGLGDAGVAIAPDVNATYWNPSKLAFIDDDTRGFSLSYSPWLRRLTPDVNLAYLSYFQKLDDRNTIGASMRYFNLGKVDSYDDNINNLGTIQPNEFSFDVSLARKFGQDISLGLTARYIHSNITGGALVGGQQSQAGNAVAADVSLYYRHPTNSGGTFAFGADISNIGPKISYSNTSTAQTYFLPTNLRLGIANTFIIDDEDDITFAFDADKLLVPTPPIRDINGNIIAGEDDNRSSISGIFSSFTDAPGGFSEEIKEIDFSPSLEYWFQHKFALRAGYFYEAPSNGDREYATFGLGYRGKDVNFDFSYIASSQYNTPLAGVVRLSLGYRFGGGK